MRNAVQLTFHGRILRLFSMSVY